MRVELGEERFPDIVVSLDSQLSQPLEFGEEIPIAVRIINQREHRIKIEHARLRLGTTKLDNRRTNFSRTEKIETTLAAGESLDLSQYLYFGFTRSSPSTTSENMLAQWLGPESGGITLVAPRTVGDCLLGILLELKIDGKPNYDIYVAKYYFDESENTITPYYVLGLSKAELE